MSYLRDTNIVCRPVGPTAREATEYLFLSNRTGQVFETEACVVVEPVEVLTIGRDRDSLAAEIELEKAIAAAG